MAATRDLLREMRDRAADRMGGRPAVQEWEITAMHRLHSPATTPARA